MVRMIIGTAILALGVLGVLDALLNPTAFKGDATPAAWGFLLVFVIPGSLLFVFGWRARIGFKKTATQNPGDGAVILRSTTAGESTKGQPMDTADQEKTADEILQFLAAFGSNLKQLVAGLEDDDPFKVNMTLQVMTAQDLGAQLAATFDLSEARCLERLADSLKTIEADLTRAGAFTGKAASPTLIIFVPSKLMVVKSVLAHLQEARGGTSAAKTAAPPAPGALDLPSGSRMESILAQQVLSEDNRALKVVVLESGFQAGVLSNLLIRVHRVPKDWITQLGGTCTDEQIDELLKKARPIVLVPRGLINHRRCVFRLPTGSNRLVTIQFLDGEVFSFPITCEGPTLQFKPGWFS